MEAAIGLFSKCCYHATTVPMIAAEAKSSVCCFYTYFRNKEDVLVTILKHLEKK
ncbi:TetR/AcrR family transcriptional regulator [Telmatobacter bradus]|uniref:TetR/AcrR family transcriptional regulator n=1 Tax=Telmatobacter bradus TaxID=474953 RepID=UPI003B4316B0